MNFDTSVFFRNPDEKIQVSLKSDNNNWYFTWRPVLVYVNQFFLEWEMFEAGILGKTNTHFIPENFFLIVSFMR